MALVSAILQPNDDGMAARSTSLLRVEADESFHTYQDRPRDNQPEGRAWWPFSNRSSRADDGAPGEPLKVANPIANRATSTRPKQSSEAAGGTALGRGRFRDPWGR